LPLPGALYQGGLCGSNPEARREEADREEPIEAGRRGVAADAGVQAD